MVEQITAKRDGEELEPDALRWIIGQYTADRIPDYQLASLLMAVVFNGMTTRELAAWTEAMLHSGDVLDLSGVDKPKVDKHSTGGVGDKISIPLAPIVAACGVAVPMMSGRGLGHTGGTLDKLESIPGFTTQIDAADFEAQLDEIGVVMVGQTERLVPADRRIYALRDATGTVPSVPLIASSIMSKKLAEDLDGLLLDVKVGSGAFMKTESDARTLAATMSALGNAHDTPVTAILTNMDQPLGRAVGNANEILESIEILRGEGPDDVTDLTTTFAVEMLVLAGRDRSDADAQVADAIGSGAALEVLERLIERQGGDPAIVEDPSKLPAAPHVHTIRAQSAGFVKTCDAYAFGIAAVRLGAGRAKKEDDVDPGVGFLVEVAVGDEVSVGDTIATVRFRNESSLENALGALTDAVEISQEPVPRPDLILGAVT